MPPRRRLAIAEDNLGYTQLVADAPATSPPGAPSLARSSLPGE